MYHGMKITCIVIMNLLFCFPCIASKSELRVFDTKHFTINLPAHMRQVNSRELPSPENKNNSIYVFVESDKVRKKSILLMISLKKINDPDRNLLDEIAKSLRDCTASHTDCKGNTSGLAETRIAGQKCYYFEKKSENCAVTLERYWVTTSGDRSFLIYLARPAKGDEAVAGRIEKEIAKIKLK